jgi:hypothetical protein
MIGAQVQVLSALSLLCWSAGAFEECRSWYDKLRRFESHHALALAGCDYYVVGARLAIHDGQFADATALIDRGRQLPQGRLESPRMQLLACDLKRRFLESGGSCSNAEFEELMRFHTRARNLGEQDEITLVLLHALMARGETLVAKELLSNYLLRRRERFEIPGSLRRFLVLFGDRS